MLPSDYLNSRSGPRYPTASDGYSRSPSTRFDSDEDVVMRNTSRYARTRHLPVPGLTSPMHTSPDFPSHRHQVNGVGSRAPSRLDIGSRAASRRQNRSPDHRSIHSRASTRASSSSLRPDDSISNGPFRARFRHQREPGEDRGRSRAPAISGTHLQVPEDRGRSRAPAHRQVPDGYAGYHPSRLGGAGMSSDSFARSRAYDHASGPSYLPPYASNVGSHHRFRAPSPESRASRRQSVAPSYYSQRSSRAPAAASSSRRFMDPSTYRSSNDHAGHAGSPALVPAPRGPPSYYPPTVSRAPTRADSRYTGSHSRGPYGPTPPRTPELRGRSGGHGFAYTLEAAAVIVEDEEITYMQARFEEL